MILSNILELLLLAEYSKYFYGIVGIAEFLFYRKSHYKVYLNLKIDGYFYVNRNQCKIVIENMR